MNTIISSGFPVIILSAKVLLSGARNTANSLLEIPVINKLFDVVENTINRLPFRLPPTTTTENFIHQNYLMDNWIRPLENKVENLVEKVLPVPSSHTLVPLYRTDKEIETESLSSGAPSDTLSSITLGRLRNKVNEYMHIGKASTSNKSETETLSTENTFTTETNPATTVSPRKHGEVKSEKSETISTTADNVPTVNQPSATPTDFD